MLTGRPPEPSGETAAEEAAAGEAAGGDGDGQDERFPLLPENAPLALFWLRLSGGRCWGHDGMSGLPLPIDWTQVKAVAELTGTDIAGDFDTLAAMAAEAHRVRVEAWQRRRDRDRGRDRGRDRSRDGGQGGQRGRT